MMVVMALVGLLLAIALPNYFQALDSGRLKAQAQNLTLMREAIDKFYGDNARYPDQLDELVGKRYLRAIPVDPLTERADWIVIAPPEAGQGAVYDLRSSATSPAEMAAAAAAAASRPADAEAPTPPAPAEPAASSAGAPP